MAYFGQMHTPSGGGSDPEQFYGTPRGGQAEILVNAEVSGHVQMSLQTEKEKPAGLYGMYDEGAFFPSAHEFGFIPTDILDSDLQLIEGLTQFITCLNGYGRDAYQRFGNDRDAVRRYMERFIHVVGTVKIGTSPYGTPPTARKRAELIVSGLRNFLAELPMPIGTIIRAALPTEDIIAQRKQTGIINNARKKITLMAKPVETGTLAGIFRSLVRHYMEPKMHPLLKNTQDYNPEKSCVATDFDLGLLNGILFLKVLMENNIVGPTAAFARHMPGGAVGHAITLQILMQGMQLSKGTDLRMQNPVATPKDFFNDIRMDIIKAQHYEGTVKTHRMTHVRIPNQNPIDIAVPDADRLQSSLWIAGLSAHAEMINFNNKNVQGMVVRGSTEKNHMAAFI